MENERNKPSYERRLGTCRVAVWENVAADTGRLWFNVALSRRYKDGEHWRDASTYNGIADLLHVRELVDSAKAWIAERLAMLGVAPD